MSYIFGRPFWTTHALGLVLGQCSDPATKGRLSDLEVANRLDATVRSALLPLAKQEIVLPLVACS